WNRNYYSYLAGIVYKERIQSRIPNMTYKKNLFYNKYMHHKKNFIISTLLSIVSFFLLVTPAFAHIIVTPHQVGIAAIQNFTVSVPNEKNTPVVSVRLLIPKEISSVTPNTTPGWTISTKSKENRDN